MPVWVVHSRPLTGSGAGFPPARNRASESVVTAGLALGYRSPGCCAAPLPRSCAGRCRCSRSSPRDSARCSPPAPGRGSSPSRRRRARLSAGSRPRPSLLRRVRRCPPASTAGARAGRRRCAGRRRPPRSGRCSPGRVHSCADLAGVVAVASGTSLACGSVRRKERIGAGVTGGVSVVAAGRARVLFEAVGDLLRGEAVGVARQRELRVEPVLLHHVDVTQVEVVAPVVVRRVVSNTSVTEPVAA